MSRRGSALLWGVVGGLTFLVLTTGYRIAVEPLPLGAAGVAAGAVGIGAVVAAVSYVAEDRLTSKRRT